MQKAVSHERKAVKSLEVNAFFPSGKRFQGSRFSKVFGIFRFAE